MPEGPEHYFAAKLINDTCHDRIFHGEVQKSELATNETKHPTVTWKADQYQIMASSRGKEIKLILTELLPIKGVKSHGFKTGQLLSLVFQFGMSGSFRWSSIADIPKHAHLRFFAETVGEDKKHVLCYHDPRRFGRWRVGSEWSDDRGPDPAREYQLFRSNIVDNLSDSIFKRPICEVLLNQKYFNGIGNYLRAEILYRSKVAPFERAKDVLENLDKEKTGSDILLECSTVVQEAFSLYVKGYNINVDKPGKDYTYIYTGEDEVFRNWVQCYGKSNMKSITDSNARTIWFFGNAGPLVPRDAKKLASRSKKKSPGKSTEKSPSKSKEKFSIKSKTKAPIKSKELLSETFGVLKRDLKKVKTEENYESEEFNIGRVTRSQLKKLAK